MGQTTNYALEVNIHMEKSEQQKWKDITSCRSLFAPGKWRRDQDGGYNQYYLQ